MQLPFWAAAVAAASFLSACGFVPPAPPMPPDSKRVAINHEDPRKLGVQQPAAAPTPAPEPVPIVLAPPPPPSSPAQAAAKNTGQSATANTTVDSSHDGKQPPIPVPLAPPIANPATPVTPAPAAPTLAPIVVTANAIPMAQALASLPQSAPAPQEPIAVAAPEPTPEPAPKPIPVVVKEIWRIGPDDGTVRQALTRWAAKANWTFGPDQWELNFDLPIQAPAEFEAESFQDATQALSQAIAMTESPIRPCFYGNRVLRVVPFTRSCNRSPATQS